MTTLPCKVCDKRRDTECSHVDCPNRKRITAQVVGDEHYTDSRIGREGTFTPPGCAIRRVPNLFED